MKMTKQVLAVSMIVAGSITGAFAADGAALYKKHNCHTCHGEDGKKPLASNYPKLNGQNVEYTLTQLKDIKSGKRNNGLTAAMKPMIAAVSDADFKAIAEYLEKVK